MSLSFILALILPFGAMASSFSLEEYLQQVRVESPDLASEKATVEAAEARATGIRIPSPMVGYMEMKEGMASRRGFEFGQEVPFPTKIFQEKSARNLNEQAVRSASAARASEVLADARQAFVKFWTAEKKVRVLKEREGWLRKHIRFSRSSVRSDTGAQLHLLDMESEADLARNEIFMAESDLIEAKNRLQVFAPNLNLEGKSLVLPSPVELGHLQDLPNQIVESKAKELEAKGAWASYAKQSYLPNLFLRYQALNANEMSPKTQEIMLGITIPFLYFWQPKAEVAEARAEALRAESSLHKAKVETEAMLDSLRKRASALSRQIKIYESKVIPRAERSTELLANVSLRTSEGLNRHREVMLGYLDLQLKALSLREDYEGVVSQIMKISGLNALGGK